MEVSDLIYTPAVLTRGTAPCIHELGTRTVSGVGSNCGEMNPVFQEKDNHHTQSLRPLDCTTVHNTDVRYGIIQRAKGRETHLTSQEESEERKDEHLAAFTDYCKTRKRLLS
jgi:hypothetical protein